MKKNKKEDEEKVVKVSPAEEIKSFEKEISSKYNRYFKCANMQERDNLISQIHALEAKIARIVSSKRRCAGGGFYEVSTISLRN